LLPIADIAEATLKLSSRLQQYSKIDRSLLLLLLLLLKLDENFEMKEDRLCTQLALRTVKKKFRLESDRRSRVVDPVEEREREKEGGRRERQGRNPFLRPLLQKQTQPSDPPPKAGSDSRRTKRAHAQIAKRLFDAPFADKESN
jgi:hypothetical protein